MAKKLDPRLLEILTTYGERPEDALWDCHGTWVAYHKAIERIAAKAKITFDMPQIIEADTAAKTATIAVRGTMGERVEWSFGEASPANNKNAYPFAMAEKRAKDRVVIKLVGLAGIYSEEEADDFKRKPVETPFPVEDETYAPPPRKANGLPEQGWREDGSRTSFWLKTNGTWDALKAMLDDDLLDCTTLLQLEKVRKIYRELAREQKFNRQFLDALTHEFNAHEKQIMNAMEAAELAEIPLKDALTKSLDNERNLYVDNMSAG